MGRISKALTVSELLRSWSYQGVEYIFAPEGSPLREFIKPAKAAPSSNATKMPGPKIISDPAASSIRQQAVPPQPKKLGQQFDRPVPVAPAVPAAQCSPVPDSKNAVEGFAGSDWPEVWLTYAQKVQAGRPLLWTYPEAGLDLAGQGDKWRSEIIRKVISGLMLPAGSSNFWPHRSQPQAASEGEVGYFLQGISALNPKFILAFGSDTLSGISPETKFKKYTYFSFEERILLMLPNISELATQAELDACLAFLSTFAKPLQRGG